MLETQSPGDQRGLCVANGSDLRVEATRARSRREKSVIPGCIRRVDHDIYDRPDTARGGGVVVVDSCAPAEVAARLSRARKTSLPLLCGT